MKFLKNTIGFMALFAVLPAFAVTTRASVTGAVSSRLPTQRASSTSYNSTNTAYNLLSNSDCIDAYTSCIQESSLCGEKFEKCTNTVEFQGKMSQCLSALSMCDASGINALFGTSNISALGTVKSYKSGTKNKEVAEYTYPTAGSVLGQKIASGYIASRLDTQSCIKKYTNCLRGTDVCGKDFELCTGNSEFKKQRLLCDNVLSRCQSDGVKALFDSEVNLDAPAATSRIGEMITDGAAYAALNATSTCYAKVNNCIQTACKENPYKCKAGVSTDLTAAADNIRKLSKEEGTTTADIADALSALVAADNSVTRNSDVEKYIAGVCKDTISKNASCMAVFVDDLVGKVPNNSQLKNEEYQEETWNDAYNDRITKVLSAQLETWIEEFDTAAKSACVDKISQCAMQVCGGGNGVSCYVKVFGKGKDKSFKASINGAGTYDEIEAGCAAVVNTDQNCVYAAMAKDGTIDSFSYQYSDGDAFKNLFGSSSGDPIGAVAALNKKLSESYNDASIANAKTQCQSAATSCIRNKCGDDYVKCYRNRSDIMSSLTNSGERSYNNSMNKVGGVLDATIVLGLCLDSVKNNAACQTHLAAEVAGTTEEQTTAWVDSVNGDDVNRYSSIGEGWFGAGDAIGVKGLTGGVQRTNEDGQTLCYVKNSDEYGVCGTENPSGKKYEDPMIESYAEYAQTKAQQGIFRDVIYSEEKRVQAIYNGKLTEEQNACLAMNNNSGLNAKDGRTYAWVKLNGNKKVPTNYATNGLKDTEFTGSNEIYDSFCRVRVELRTTDNDYKGVLEKSGANTVAYFAVGDVFTCGSWLDDKIIKELSGAYAEKASGGTDENGKLKDGQKWAVAGISLLGSGLGAWGFDALQSKTGLGGLMKTTNSLSKKDQTISNKCLNEVDAEITKWKNFQDSHKVNAKSMYEDYELKYDTNISGIDGKSLQRLSYQYKAPVDGKPVAEGIAENTVDQHIWDLQQHREDYCGVESVTKGGKAGRAVVDVIGAGIGGAATGIATWQALQAANKKKYTEAEQEWLNAIGSKIECYIGGEQAGSFGDIVSTSLD